ncbi:MAG: glycosyltransferase [Verrucomicrobiota bacterium]|jgi:glycosyltransferase involved in cell wall biosynthesis|nr:glycosyltransferase [Verrucomicrobiota bacterium]
MSRKPKIAFWFRYGPADHSELFHAMPAVFSALAPHCEIHYYGMKTGTPLPDDVRRNLVLHELPFHVARTSSRDKMLKTLLWILSIPCIALRCRLSGVRTVYMDETIPLTAGLARLFFGRKVAITIADFFTDIYFTGKAAFLGRAIRTLDLRSWKTIPLIFTRAKATRTWLAGKGIPPQRVHPVYDPCDFTIYHPLPEPDRQAIRKQFGFAETDVVLVHHGILHPNTGNDWILRALSELTPRFPQVKYLLIGDGPEKAALQRQIHDLHLEATCTLTGWLPTLPDVNRALNAGDIGLVMRTGAQSDDFHMTGALVHSMACGLPLLAARLGGVMEVAQENRNGLLFSPSDREEFKTKLLELAQSPGLRRRLGQNAEQDAHVYFDMDRTVRDTVTPLLELVFNGAAVKT